MNKMTLKECYAALEGGYDEVLGRLHSERLVQKFVLKFPDDGSYKLLCDSMESGNWEEAFRAAHTIKGMCQNLSFTKLGASADALTEALRGGKHEGAETLLAQVQEDYEKTVTAIRTFQASL